MAFKKLLRRGFLLMFLVEDFPVVGLFEVLGQSDFLAIWHDHDRRSDFPVSAGFAEDAAEPVAVPAQVTTGD